MRPRPVPVRQLVPDLPQGCNDILEFDRLACPGTGFLSPRTHASRVRGPCCQDGVLFAERQIRIIDDLVGVPKGAGRMQQQRTQVKIRGPGARPAAARFRHACLSPHRTTPGRALFAPMRQTRCSTSAADRKLLILITTSSFEQHGYERDHDALLASGRRRRTI